MKDYQDNTVDDVGINFDLVVALFAETINSGGLYTYAEIALEVAHRLEFISKFDFKRLSLKHLQAAYVLTATPAVESIAYIAQHKTMNDLLNHFCFIRPPLSERINESLQSSMTFKVVRNSDLDEGIVIRLHERKIERLVRESVRDFGFAATKEKVSICSDLNLHYAENVDELIAAIKHNESVQVALHRMPHIDEFLRVSYQELYETYEEEDLDIWVYGLGFY